MTMYENVPLSPDELPQQRLVAVKDLPARPAGWDVLAPAPLEVSDRFHKIGEHGSATTLAGVEWGWSPMHGRIDTYVLERGEEYFLLWNRIAPGVVDDQTHCLLLAAAPRHDVDDRSAAVWLLHAAFEDERDTIALERFHHINHSGLLSVADLHALARQVWPGSGQGEEHST